MAAGGPPSKAPVKPDLKAENRRMEIRRIAP